ncbi:MAG: hypothetical protein IKB14_07265, partial [Rikenellaceae bacterium]|nr:hypothetical protein [Rikenellaceae bacterium]
MMKRSILTMFAVALLAVVATSVSAQTTEPQSQEKSATKKGAQMTFTTNSYDFGDIARKGGDVECTFEF